MNDAVGHDNTFWCSEASQLRLFRKAMELTSICDAVSGLSSTILESAFLGMDQVERPTEPKYRIQKSWNEIL